MAGHTNAQTARYRGCSLFICHEDVLVVAPDGDAACFPSMKRVRLWVKRKRKELNEKGESDG